MVEEEGYIAKWEARGEEHNAIKVAQKMIRSGFPIETVAAMTELTPEKVKTLYDGI